MTPVLLNLLNSLRKMDKCVASLAFYHFFSTPLINSIIRPHVRFSMYEGHLESS